MYVVSAACEWHLPSEWVNERLLYVACTCEKGVDVLFASRYKLLDSAVVTN